MNELKFNSQVCTSIEQSQRLLNLGLKPETADMVYTDANLPYKKDEFRLICKEYLQLHKAVNYEISPFTFIPAWSLHRLLSIGINGDYMGLWNININIDTVEDLFEQLIKLIEWTIEDGAFNKEYLKQ